MPPGGDLGHVEVGVEVDRNRHDEGEQRDHRKHADGLELREETIISVNVPVISDQESTVTVRG